MSLTAFRVFAIGRQDAVVAIGNHELGQNCLQTWCILSWDKQLKRDIGGDQQERYRTVVDRPHHRENTANFLFVGLHNGVSFDLPNSTADATEKQCSAQRWEKQRGFDADENATGQEDDTSECVDDEHLCPPCVARVTFENG